MGASDSFKPQFHFYLCDSVHLVIQHSLPQREMSQHSKAQYGFALLMQREKENFLMPCANLCKLVNASVIIKCSLNFSSSFGRILVSIGESFGVSFNVFDVWS